MIKKFNFLFRLSPIVFVLALIVVHGFSQEADADKLPNVYLNHVYVAPDLQTYEELNRSEFLRKEFAVFEERTTTRNDDSYTGIYFYGRTTYFEFLMPDEKRPAGGTGIGFSTDGQGEIGAILAAIERTGTKTWSGLNTRRVEERDVPWFTMGGIDRDSIDPASWLMEYDPAFLKEWHPEAGGPKSGIRRGDILSRYAAKLTPGRGPGDFLMQDLTQVVVALTDSDAKRFIEECRLMGLVITSLGKEHLCKLPEAAIRIRITEEGPTGIRELHFRVLRFPNGPREYRFGKTVLSFKDSDTAVWVF